MTPFRGFSHKYQSFCVERRSIMKKLLTLTVLVAAAAAMTFTACEKKAETPGEKLDQAIDNTNSGVHKFTKKAEQAAEDTNDAIDKAIKDMQK